MEFVYWVNKIKSNHVLGFLIVHKHNINKIVRKINIHVIGLIILVNKEHVHHLTLN